MRRLTLRHLSFFLFSAIGCMALAQPLNGQILISEWMASNGDSSVDEDGDSSDWVEIWNRGNQSVSLENFSLSVDLEDPRQWVFPSVSLQSGQRLLIWASGKDRVDPSLPLHTNFKLNADGGSLGLWYSDGQTLVSAFEAYPKQRRDVSYGQDGSGQNRYFLQPTPGQANGTGVIGFVADTQFSVDRGFYTDPFSLVISTQTEGASIRYTTDGTMPTAGQGNLYTGPIRIDQTTSLRAIAYRSGYEPSNVDTQTYLFLKDVIRQAADGRAPTGWPTRWGSNTVDYGMDPDVVDDPAYRDTIIDDMQTLPSYSIVMNLDDFFGSSGIYSNPGQDGREWERPCSVELIHPGGEKGFQINAGIRVRGGFSRSTSNPKHALRLFFRNEYGAGKLNYPVFGPDATQSFDGFDLRTFQNYSWSFQGDSRGIFLRDVFSRDVQLAMGHHAERGDFAHLYINGMYWGLYNTVERPEASYAASYYGGQKEDYDVIKVEAGPYTINATDGNTQAWRDLFNASRAGFDSMESYQKVLGNNPDGTPNPDYPVLVDPINLIDYMLIILYGGNLDAPISNFLGNTRPNNFYSVRSRVGELGFQHFVHDAEHTLLNANENRLGPYTAGNTFTYFNPQYLWQQLQANEEFTQLIGDRIHRHLFNDGALTTEKATELYLKRKNQIDRAVVAESARWGDSKRSNPFTRDRDWISSINSVLNSFIERRSSILLNQLKSRNLYPDTDAPIFSQFGGVISNGFELLMDAGNATEILYTLDGSDPRLLGGSRSPAARNYQQGVRLTEHASVKARGLRAGQWSALVEAHFIIQRDFTDLMISEIMYHPSDEEGVDGDTFEFIELKNVSNQTMQLGGVHFTAGIDYTFEEGAELAPGAFAVLVHDAPSFASRYPGVPVAGVYEGRLNNGGEAIALVHASGTPLTHVRFGDEEPWPVLADGEGFSLVPRQTLAMEFQDEVGRWRASSLRGGSPGQDDFTQAIPQVVINELLAHTDLPLVDAIELFNPLDQPADLSGWYLTDDRSDPKQYQLPPGSVIPPKSYLVLTESDFNPRPGSVGSFTFSSLGESAYLFSADASGQLTGYSQGFDFGPTANGVSLGRYLNSLGEVDYVAQQSMSLGTDNTGPLVGPVVINEIHSQPRVGEPAYIEIKNISGEEVPLFDPLYPSNTWQVEGIGFSLPLGIRLAPGELLILASVDEAQFRSVFAIPDSVKVLGPFAGQLQPDGERIKLLRPDDPEETTSGTMVPMILVDSVRYDDQAPWPDLQAVAGASLEKIQSAAYGNDPAHWRSSFGQPSPGVDNDGNRAPVVEAGESHSLSAEQFPLIVRLGGEAWDDGLPESSPGLIFEWLQVEGPGQLYFASPDNLNTELWVPGAGDWKVALTASDGELEASDILEIHVERPFGSGSIIEAGATWRYLDRGNAPASTWKDVSFDDSQWSQGEASFGYGDGDETTVLDYGGNASNKRRTYYFRHAFSLADPQSVKSLQLAVVRDDGVVVYVNGKEVFRDNLPEGIITFDTFALSAVGGADETTFFEASLDEVALGRQNVIAVELHQANASSSDTSFDLKLDGEIAPNNQAPEITIAQNLQGEVGEWLLLDGSWSDDGLPVTPGLVGFVWDQVQGPGEVLLENPQLFPSRAWFDQPGEYELALTYSDGVVTRTLPVRVSVHESDPEEGVATLMIEMGPTPQLVLKLLAGQEALISVSTDLKQWTPLWTVRSDENDETFRWDLSEYTDSPAIYLKSESSPVP